MKNIIASVILIILNIPLAHSQSNITRIEFENYNSIVIGSEIKILIYASSDNPFATIEVTRNKKVSKSIISSEKFNEICNAILKVSPRDLFDESTIMLDAGSTKIHFSKGFDGFSYIVNGLEASDISTTRKEFLLATEIIIETANIKLSELN
jgi:hypothetical protein